MSLPFNGKAEFKQGSVDGCRRERLQRLTNFDSLSVQNLEATGAVGANLRPFSSGGGGGYCHIWAI